MRFGFIAPTLLLLIAVNIFPLLYSIYLSFTNAELIGGDPGFIGTSNYSFVFFDPRYAAALRTTGLFVITAVSVELALGYTLALALRGNFRCKPVLLTALLVPMMMPPVRDVKYFSRRRLSFFPFLCSTSYGVRAVL